MKRALFQGGRFAAALLAALSLASPSAAQSPTDLTEHEARRLHPLLRSIRGESREGLRRIRTLASPGLEAPDPTVEVLVTLRPGASRGDLQGLSNALELGAQAGRVVTGRIPVRLLDLLARSGAVERVSPSPRVRPRNDVAKSNQTSSGLYLGVANSQGSAGYSGAEGQGVIVGVVDTGIDFRHPDFLDAANASRILYLWDQSDSGGPAPSGYTGGTEWTKSQLDAAVAGSSCRSNIESCSVRERDTEGHGTHVAGSAAGDDATFTGLAPKAELVIVKATTVGGVINGVSYVFAKAAALGRPAAVNLSLGTHSGPHDGTSDFEQAIAALTGAGRIVVGAAGNERNDAVHGGANVTGSFAFRLSFFEAADPITSGEVEFWHDGLVGYSVNVKVAGDSTGVTAASGQNASGTSSGVTVQLYNGSSETNNGDEQVFLQMTKGSDIAAGTTVTVSFSKTSGSGDTRVDGWAEEGALGFDSGFGLDATSRLIVEPQNSDSVITVGAYVTKKAWTDVTGASWQFTSLTLGSLASFSSPGPTRDGRVKPDLAGPGRMIGSSYSQSSSADTGMCPDGFPNCMLVGGTSSNPTHILYMGTSMATPIVTGIAALRLQADPTLTPSALKSALQSKARTETQMGSLPNNDWGAGKALGTPPAGPAPFGLAGTAISTSRIDWSWTNSSQNELGVRVRDASSLTSLSGDLPANAQSYSETGLQPGSPYSVKVEVFNDAGATSSGASAPVYTLPADPSGLAVVETTTDTATLSWSETGNGPETVYEVVASLDGFASSTTPVAFSQGLLTGATTLLGLTPGSSYQFRARARNAAGALSAYSNTASADLPTIGRPPIVVGLSGAGQGGAVLWNWSLAAGATSYRVYFEPPSVEPVAAPAEPSWLETGLGPNEASTIRVSGANDQGEGPVSDWATAFSAAAAPGAPQASAASASDISISWGDGGNPAGTPYLAQFDPLAFPGGVLSNRGSATATSARSASFGLLLPNTTYFFRVRAGNAQGLATAFTANGATVTLAAAPSAPALSQADETAAVVSWSGAGNPLDTVYEVGLSTDGFVSDATVASPFADALTQTSFRFDGLAAGRAYWCRVRARSRHGVPTAFSPALRFVTVPTSEETLLAQGARATLTLRDVTVDVPDGGFDRAVRVTLRLPLTFPPDSSLVGPLRGTGFGVEIDPGGVQPARALTIRVGYNESAVRAAGLRETDLVLARWDEARASWVPLYSRADPGSNAVTAPTPHLSTFQVMAFAPAAAGSAAVVAYPNPARPGRGETMTFAGLPAQARLEIYTISGRRVRELRASGAMASWDGRNAHGEPAASGVYIVRIADEAGAGDATIKVMLER